MKTQFKIFWVIFALLWAGMVHAKEEGKYPFWRLVAKSYLIVEGTIEVPASDIQKAVQSGEHDYVQVEVAVKQAIKGQPDSQNFNFRYYTDTETYGGVSREKILAQNGQPVILFLQKVQEKYYLAAYAPETLQPVSRDLVQRIEQENDIQEKQIQESDRYAAGHVLPRETELQSLIEMMIDKRIDPGTAQAVYEAVIALGKDAVPTIIKYLDDRRKLHIPKITLEPWWPDAHEGLVHYGPETVTDVLSVALMVLTNEDLTAIYNGGTELERAQAVRIWKIYERRTYGKTVDQ